MKQRLVLVLLVLSVAACGPAPSGLVTPLPTTGQPAPLASETPPAAPTPFVPSATATSLSPSPISLPATASLPTETPPDAPAATRRPTPPPTVLPAPTLLAAENVTLVGHTGGTPGPLAVRDSWAYMGRGPEFAILDVSRPDRPVRVGYVVLPGAVQAIALADDYAFVAAWSGGLWAIDVSDPAAPVIAGSFDVAAEYTNARDVAVLGGMAYVADDEGLRVMDVREASRPTEIGFYDTEGVAQAVALAGGQVYVGERVCTSAPHQSPTCRGRVHMLDVSQRNAPALLGTAEVAAYTGVVDLVAEASPTAGQSGGGHVLAAGGLEGLWLLDFADPSAPIEVGRIEGTVWDVSAAGGIVALAGSDGLRLVEVINPTTPVPVGSAALEAEVVSVAFDGRTAYAVDRDGLAVVDTSNPTAPAVAGRYAAPGEVSRISAAGTRVYAIAILAGRLSIVDLGRADDPVQLGAATVPRQAMAVAAANEMVYVADGNCAGSCDGQVWAIDASDPARPVQVGAYDPPGFAWDVAVSGSTAYVAARADGVFIVDVSQPTAPLELGRYDTPGFAMRVAPVSPALLAVADREGGALILNVSDPARPALVASFQAPDEVWDVAVSEDVAVVATRSFGVRMVDISNPTQPVELGIYTPPDYASVYDVEMAGQIAYLAAGQAGLRVIDMSDPAQPVEIAFFDTPGSAEAVTLIGEQVLIADQRGGLFLVLPALDNAP